MCLFVCILMSEAARRGQEKVLGVLELESQVVFSCHHKCWKLNLGYLEENEHPYLLSHLSYPLHCRLYFSMKILRSVLSIMLDHL